MAVEEEDAGASATGGTPRPIAVRMRPARELLEGANDGMDAADHILEIEEGGLPDDAAPAAIVPTVDPLIFCARLWSLCTKRPYDPDQTPVSPEFLDFIEHKGLETPSVTPLFDVEYYSERISWQIAPINYLLHYCENCLDMPLQPHVLFDNNFVLLQSGMEKFDVPPLIYFLEANDPQLSPHPLFDPSVYADAVGEEFLNGDLPIMAFISRWADRPAAFSPFFSRRFYSLHEPVVRFGQLNPLVHFMSMPPDRRRDPSPMFQRGWYAGSMADDDIGATEPLVHYIRHGLRKGLMPNPFARRELRAGSLGLPALVEALRRYLSFPAEPVAG